jgi:hypothetical protein
MVYKEDNMPTLDKIIVDFHFYSGSDALRELLNIVGVDEVEKFIEEYADNSRKFIANRDSFESEPE